MGRRPTSPLNNRLTSFDVAAPHWLTRLVLGGLTAEDVLSGVTPLYKYEGRGPNEDIHQVLTSSLLFV